MSTLEKIRSKSVLLFVIIIVALLAFILGDFLTSGRTYFGSGTTVAKAGNAKVDYTDYQARINQESEARRQQQANVDADELSRDVLNELLLEKMLENEYQDLGIVVTDEEISEALTGAVPHPAVQQFVAVMSQRLGLPAPSGAAVYDAMMNPAKYGLPAEISAPLQQEWANQERQLEKIMLTQKFARLVGGLFSANELDAHGLYDDIATTRHISYAAKPLSAITDEEAAITDDDRRAAWQEDKGTYRITEPMRAIDYIMVRIEPSAADRAAGQKAVEEALITLNAKEGVEDVAANSSFVVNNVSTTKANITDNRLKEFVDSASVGQAAIFATVGDQYSIAKLLSVTNEIDSINVTMIGRPDGAPLDSALALMAEGKKFADIVDDEIYAGRDSVWYSLAGNVPEKLKDALVNGEIGRPFILTDTVSGQAQSALYVINRRHAAVPFYELALIDYTVDPSQETLSQLSSDLHTYVSNNSSAADFAANAQEAGYTIMSDVVRASSPHLGGAPDSRSAVKWVMNAKQGQVMPVFQDNKQSYLMTAAVKGIYDGDYIPWDAVIIADQINQKALHNKKAAMLAERYAGKAQDIAGYAKLMEVAPQTADAMFNSPMISGIGFGESALQGAIAAAEKGKVTGPVKGNNAVVVFVVNGQDNSGREYDFTEYANQFNRALGISTYRLQNQQSIFNLLLGDEEVENNSLNFIQGFGE